MIKFQVNQEFGIVPFATPDPSRFGCRAAVSLADFSFDEIPEIGTTFANSGLNVTKKNETWGEHVFAGVAEGQRGFVYFVFNPPIADSSVPFRSYFSSDESYGWPAVLKDLGSVIKQNPIEGGVAYYFVGARYAFVEGVNVATKVLVEEFLSATPFSEEFVSGEEPIPTPVDAKVYDGRISFPPCLHPQIEIEPRYVSSYGASTSIGVYTFEDNNPQNSTLDFNSVQKFPRTNFLSWSQFTKPAAVKVTESNLYHAVKKTYFPPDVNLFTVR